MRKARGARKRRDPCLTRLLVLLHATYSLRGQYLVEWTQPHAQGPQPCTNLTASSSTTLELTRKNQKGVPSPRTLRHALTRRASSARCSGAAYVLRPQTRPLRTEFLESALRRRLRASKDNRRSPAQARPAPADPPLRPQLWGRAFDAAPRPAAGRPSGPFLPSACAQHSVTGASAHVIAPGV
jgi:hypothetical protein